MKCLIVEDDPQLCDILHGLMEEMGHDTVCVHSIAAAMRKPLPTRDLEALVSYAAQDVGHCPTAIMALP
ncbi:hypothetical protein [Ascidiaceihabitans sp.]|uniref:hypothetical protein n=1 Tax=Ascidiaceihabitans sp. TaxID=1872644 RepID=UPI003297687F